MLLFGSPHPPESAPPTHLLYAQMTDGHIEGFRTDGGDRRRQGDDGWDALNAWCTSIAKEMNSMMVLCGSHQSNAFFYSVHSNVFLAALFCLTHFYSSL